MSEVRVWSRFERKLKNGEIARFKIQNIPKGKEREVAEFLFNHLVIEEVWLSSFEIAKNPDAVKEMNDNYTHLFSNQYGLVCLLDTEKCDENEPLQIIGCNLLYMEKKNEKLQLHMNAEEIKKIYTAAYLAEEYSPIYEKYGINEHLAGLGLLVHPEYRGLGIAVELLKARKPLCKNHGIAVTSAMFTSCASQRAAERAGYELVAEVDYKSFGEKIDLKFNNGSSPSFKFLALVV